MAAPQFNFWAIRYEFHVVPGGHDWNEWDQRLPSVFQSLFEHIGPN
jgi:enterochelin esterase-like enzyme